MKTLVVSLAIVAAILVGLFAIYEFGYTYRYRYRLTLEVDVDGQVKNGSSVIEVTNRLDFVPGRPVKYIATISGEAVFVDLGRRGNLIALLTGPNDTSAFALAAKVFNPTPYAPDREEAEQRLKRLSKLRAKVELRADQLPMLVTFKDIKDPKTVVQVRPEDLSATFGPGVRLASATLEMTDDRVTTGIDKKLPWLGELKAKKASLDGDTSLARSSNALANVLGTGSFQWGIR
jgi:hypothetical protein